MDKLQKMSDAPLLECPSCNESALKKLISAAGFRLSGSGWYETDFKSGKKKNVISDESSQSSSLKSASNSKNVDSKANGSGSGTSATSSSQ
jgi:putative FmdB family regulatory protein